MAMMDELKKKFKEVAKVTADVMNSACCNEDEEWGEKS